MPSGEVTYSPYGTTYSVVRRGSSCSGKYFQDTGECKLETGTAEAGPAVFDNMENWAASQDDPFFKGLIEESCQGALSPAACYDQLSSWGPLTGPATGVGPKQTTTTTTTPAGGGAPSTTTTTVQNHYNYTYGPNYYNYSTTTTTTTTNANGETSTTETTDGPLPNEATPPDEDADYSFQDSEFPEVTPFYEQKYPDGLSGIWNDIKTKIDNSEFIKFLQGFIPNFSGSCPSFSLNLNIGPFELGVQNLPSVCYALDFVKVILLFTAVMTFRALVFGG